MTGIKFALAVLLLMPNRQDPGHIDRAFELLKQDQLLEAEELFLRALETPDRGDGERQLIWAQLGHIYRRLERTDDAASAFEAALGFGPDAGLYQSLGYSRISLGQADAAMAAFEKAIRLNGGNTRLFAQMGYLKKNAGRTKSAREQFIRALQFPPDGRDTDLRARLRREVRNLARRPSLSSFLFLRAGDVGDAPPAGAREAIGQSQIALIGEWPVPDSDGRLPDIRVFGRSFWALDDDASIRAETGQAGFGAEIRPFRGVNAIFGIERFVSLGAEARDDWLVRARFSTGQGYEAPISGPESWPYWSFYADAALIGLHDADLFGAAALEGGYAFSLGGHWTIVPHVLLNGLVQDDTFNTTSLIEIGGGSRFHYRFGGTPTVAAGRSLRIDIQWRQALAGDSQGANGLTLTWSVQF